MGGRNPRPWTFLRIDELLRMPSPAPVPQALAFDGELLWMGSWETQRLYGIVPQQFTVQEEAGTPGKPVGAVAVGDELRLVCSEKEQTAGSSGASFPGTVSRAKGFRVPATRGHSWHSTACIFG